MGIVLDFGWKRTEEGMQWEVEDWRRSVMTTRMIRDEREALVLAMKARKAAEMLPKENGGWVGKVPWLGDWW